MKKLLAFIALCPLLTGAAHAQIVPTGSAVNFFYHNAPGCPDSICSTSTTFGALTIVGNGTVDMSMESVPTPGGGEWVVFNLSTLTGVSLAGDIGANWQLEMNYHIAKDAIFDGVVNQFTANGLAYIDLTNFDGICCVTTSIPPEIAFLFAGGGDVYANSGFSVPVTAGEFDAPNAPWDQISVNPFSFVGTGGMNADTTNGFNFAIHFDPVSTGVPEPSTWSMMLLGFAFLGYAGYRGRRSAVAAAF
jgi:hypothetical protein